MTDERVLPRGRAGRGVRGPAAPQATIAGRFVDLVPLEPDAHAPALYERSHAEADDDVIWTYMAYGPFDGLDEMRAWLTANAASTDPLVLHRRRTGERRARRRGEP